MTFEEYFEGCDSPEEYTERCRQLAGPRVNRTRDRFVTFNVSVHQAADALGRMTFVLDSIWAA